MVVRNLMMMLLISLSGASFSADRADGPPAPPEIIVPPFDYDAAATTCIGCDEPFDFASHKAANDAIVSSDYISQLRRAMYVQDTRHQFHSKAHFDNCHFVGSTEYLDELWNEVGLLVSEAIKAKSSGDEDDVKISVRKAFFKLGQILHAVQDFYAHSNYVELSTMTAKNVLEIPIVRPWRIEERDELGKLIATGLVSGTVFWGFPKNCEKGVLSHGKLAKDTPRTVAGSKRIGKFENMTQHRIALVLAREASFELMTDAFNEWPLLKTINGPYVGFEVMIDRRKVDASVE